MRPSGRVWVRVRVWVLVGISLLLEDNTLVIVVATRECVFTCRLCCPGLGV